MIVKMMMTKMILKMMMTKTSVKSYLAVKMDLMMTQKNLHNDCFWYSKYLRLTVGKLFTEYIVQNLSASPFNIERGSKRFLLQRLRDWLRRYVGKLQLGQLRYEKR